MNLLSELFDGGTPAMQKKKKITFYTVAVTAALIAVLLLTLIISLIASAIASRPPKQDEGEDELPVSIVTSAGSIDININEGEILMLDSAHPLLSKPELILMKSKERPQTSEKTNAYTIGGMNTFYATEEALDALNSMIGAFYKSKRDDNIYISNAYDSAKEGSQDALFASGTTFALKYFSDLNDFSKKESIHGVDKYAWIYSSAHKYGFIIVPNSDNTSNVFRYVGIAHATAMKNEKLDVEDYLDMLKTKTPDAPLTVKVNNKNAYAVYYIAEGAEALLPTEYPYSVSGNNVDGYIITVDLSEKVSG